MSGLIEKLHLQDVLKDIMLETTSDNLEDIYSELFARPECAEARMELERRLYAYFASLELPDEPTVYDLLVLSLTEKDVIATFNWDPLLIQAYVRCHRITNRLPHLFCLHGNVAISYCEEHNEFGTTDAVCPVCGKVPPPIKLLYPVKEKNYKDDSYRQLCKARNNGRILTPDGLRVICEGLNRDPEAIAKHMLEALGQMRNKGEQLDCRHSSS